MWRVFTAIIVVAGAIWLLYAVWRSPHRVDLSTYGAYAIPVVVATTGVCGWIWRSRKQQVGTLNRSEFDRLSDQLAEAVKNQWTRAAGERGLLEPEPIPVIWGQPSVALTGPVAVSTLP